MDYILNPDGSLVIGGEASIDGMVYLRGYNMYRENYCTVQVVNAACANHYKLHDKNFLQQLYNRPFHFTYSDKLNVYSKFPSAMCELMMVNRIFLAKGIIPDEDIYMKKYVPRNMFDISGMKILPGLNRSFQVKLLDALVSCYKNFIQFMWRVRDVENVNAVHTYAGEILVTEGHSFSIHHGKNGTNYMQLRLANVELEVLQSGDLDFAYSFSRSRNVIDRNEKHTTRWENDDVLKIRIPKYIKIKEGIQKIDPMPVFYSLINDYIIPFFAANGIEVRVRPKGDFYHCIATFPCNIDRKFLFP